MRAAVARLLPFEGVSNLLQDLQAAETHLQIDRGQHNPDNRADDPNLLCAHTASIHLNFGVENSGQVSRREKIIGTHRVPLH